MIDPKVSTAFQSGLSTAMTFAIEMINSIKPEQMLAQMEGAGLPEQLVVNTKMQLLMFASLLQPALTASHPTEVTAAQRVAAASQHLGFGHRYFTHG